MTPRAKISLVLSGLLVLSIGATGGILLFQSAKYNRREVRVKQQLLAENRAFALHDNFEILVLELSRLADRPQIDLADRDPSPELRLLASTHEKSVLYNTAVLLISADGTCVAATPDLPQYRRPHYAERRWFAQAKGGAPGPFFITSDEPDLGRTLKIVVPIERKGRFTGTLVGIIALEEQNLITPALRDDLPPHTETILIDGSGRMVYPGDRLRAVPTTDWTKMIAKTTHNENDTFSNIADGEDSLFAYTPIKTTNGFSMIFR